LRLSRVNPLCDQEGAGKRALLIAPLNSYRISPYIAAAQRLGIEVLVVSQGEHSLVGDAASGLHVDFSDMDGACQRILASARRQPVDGVVGTDDMTIALASRIANELGLIHNPLHAAVLSRRKDLARARLKQAGIPVPTHWRLSLTEPLRPQIGNIRYPCVAKPLALSGSRGVIRADSPEQLQAACERVAAIVEADNTLGAEERTHVLVEEFITGREVALEGMLHAGRLRVLALFDKPDPLDGPFFEETYYTTPSRLAPDLQEQVQGRVAQTCAAYGLREGPIHAEARINGGEAWIMEVAARTIGGQCSRLLRFGTGYGLEELVLSHAVGGELALESATGGAGVLMIPIPRAGVLRRVEGVLQAQKVPYVEDLEISIREGYELVPLPEGSSYLGFIFARAPTVEQAEQALRDAHACLNVVTAPAFRISTS
jgi:biotin carboxylase